MTTKTKHLRGENHMRAKFSDRQVSEMRHMHEVLGMSRVDIAGASLLTAGLERG